MIERLVRWRPRRQKQAGKRVVKEALREIRKARRP